MTHSGNQFEHDDLRDALRRAFPAQQAPQALRDRVTAMLRNDEMWSGDDMPVPANLTLPAGHIAPPPDSFPPYTHVAWFGNLFHGARRVAMAACIAGLAMGTALYLAANRTATPDESQTQIADNSQVQPVHPFLQAAVFRHDELRQAPDPTQLPVGSLGPLPQVRTDVQNRMAAPMPEADISSQGWQLIGGKSWQAPGGCIAHIFYRRGQQTLSVFIIPPDPQGRHIRVESTTQKNHLVTTREAGQFTICVVGYSPDGKLTTQEVDRVADLIATH